MTNHLKYDVNPLNGVGDLTKSVDREYKSVRHRSVHVCSAAAAVNGTCYMTSIKSLTSMIT